MFPPMDRLAAAKRSLVDLQTNSIVPPAWRNRTSVLGGVSNAILSITGSSVVATFYSLHGLVDVLQIFALICSTISSVPFSAFEDIKDDWKMLFLGVIPNVLALNFGTTFVQSTTVLAIFIVICMVLLYLFWSMTNRIQDQTVQEGFPPERQKSSGWGLIAVSFTLSVLYLPLSTVVTHALLWSQDFWTIPNPYVNATTDPPSLPPLGPPDEFFDPLDFCYTTTMKRNEVNFAPIIVIVSVASFTAMTVWFPLRLRSIIRQVVPKVEQFTERGTRRSRNELDREYQRLLERDIHPMSFLYRDFRRGWGTYRSTYLFAKLSALLIVSVISPDNCLFRTVSRTAVTIARQAVLSAVMFSFFLLQCFRAPFIDPVNNVSEWISRLSYFLISIFGLVVTVNVPGSSILDGPILYLIYVLTYGFAFYFVCIDFGWMQRIVKRITGRMDFSIDIFSPRLDLSVSSSHVKRRTWQETITTLLLTSHECRIPQEQPMIYASAKDSEYPPYLLGFRGSPAERHVENLKILREIGLHEYTQGSRALNNHERDYALWEWIQHEYTGPDMLWTGPDRWARARFGTAWWIPFPPTLIFRYDDGGGAVLNRAEQLDAYFQLNRSREAQKKRQLRLALRALDGQTCSWPYEYREPVGNHRRLCCFGRRYHARRVLQLFACVLKINRNGRLVWQDRDFGSGFNVELAYGKDIKVSGDVLGLNDDWELTPILARFLSRNQSLILARLPVLERTIYEFRRYHRKECQRKVEALSYQFLLTVYNKPQRHGQLVQIVAEQERDLRVRDLVLGAEDAFIAGYERFQRAVSSEAAAWWYIFWDDLWRRNNDTIKNLRLHEQDFSPYYPTSIAYRPLPRPILEAFLRQRGLYGKPSCSSFFHTGLLNKIYFWLSEIVFRNTDRAVQLHVGEGASELNPSAIDALAHARSSSLGTGGGTDHDDVSIRARPIYRWEGLLEDPIQNHQSESGWLAKLGVWLGITPLWRAGIVTKGVALDVKLENGRYIRLPKANSSS
ncbi:hypothetical protein ACEPAI_869 [Sanghuangporus weigelae]